MSGSAEPRTRMATGVMEWHPRWSTRLRITSEPRPGVNTEDTVRKWKQESNTANWNKLERYGLKRPDRGETDKE